MSEFSKIAMSRTWAEIDLDALEHNVKILRGLLRNGAKFLGVCKANAYGHGMLAVARKLQECGADMLAVASVAEGIELRENGVTIPILCLGQSEPELAELICKYGITQAVEDFENANLLSQRAVEINRKIKIHVKIDTGMGRIGFFWDKHNHQAANEIAELCKLPGLDAEGIFTHFADADEPDYTELQIEKFNDALETLSQLGVTFRISHAAASVGVLKYPHAHFNMGRFGLVLYGYESTENGNEGSNLGLRPVMTVKSKISAVRKLPENYTVSYGRTCKLSRDSLIAVLPIGYADGFPRILSNKANVKIHGKICPVIGRVCMDMIMADVTDIANSGESVKAGDVAVIFDEELVTDDARKAGTIIHEILSEILPRVTRVYVENTNLRFKA